MHAPTTPLVAPTPLAEWELQAQIRQALSDKLTGQLHVSFLNDRTETIFVQEGRVRQVYIRNHRVPDLNWEQPLTRFGRGTITIEALPARALNFRKIMLEELTPPPSQNLSTTQLATMFSLAEHNGNPTLFHLRWERAEGFVLVAGRRIPIHQTVMVTDAGAEEGSVALEQLSAWEEAQCNVTIHRGDIKSQAWLEAHLNILLEWHCRSVLKQYAHLTGSVVVRSILHNLTVLAARKGWLVRMHEQQLADTTIFASAAEAGRAYREILLSIRSQMEPIIGGALTRNLWNQSRDSVRDVYRDIQETFGLIEEAQ